ncbi:hypothetical protein H131_11298 [Lysinibacillus sphaericus OT4b.31]|uniref:Uncharacterized protein n=1 Tax=Lysinibacillus sphaericus OT4b.31 TaxID=1285586 RepID=R7ZFB0_LYSSH|nr:hypothetical protein H131_11298 [Lysinibacillus sphaericus OT4b.31]
MVREILKYPIEGGGGGQKLREKTLEAPPQEKLDILHKQCDLSHISTELSQEQVQKMMQVIEEIRLNRQK